MVYCSLDVGTPARAPLSWIKRRYTRAHLQTAVLAGRRFHLMGLYCSVASYVALGVPAAKVTPILPWIGPAFLACKDGDCSLRDHPDAWEGYPGCFLPGYCGMPWPSDRGVPSPCKGWQLCSPGGMQWSAL